MRLEFAGPHIGAGFSGPGFKISPAVDLAEAALHGRATTVDVSPFATRFAEGARCARQWNTWIVPTIQSILEAEAP